jgi:F0F1-type ATP synthase assembly protein I
MAVTVVMLTLIGKYIDDYFLTKPLYTLIGALTGASVGLYNLIKSALSLLDNKENKKK